MTRARVVAHQAARPAKSARLVRGTVATVSPLTVQIAGSNAVRGLALPGQLYKAGDPVLVAVQEPAVGAVYPLTATPPPDLSVYLPKTAVGAIPTVTNLDTAPDGFAYAAVANNPLGAGVLVETFTASLSGTPWRLQRITDETRGATQSRSSYAGTWSAWAGTSTGLPTFTNLDTAPDGLGVAVGGTTSNIFGTTALVETRSATLSGGLWRFQKLSHESDGRTRTRRLWAGSWSGWAAASTA